MKTSAALISVAIALAACKDPGPPMKAASAEPDWASAFKHLERYDAGRHAVVVEVEIAPGFHAYTTGETTGRPLAVELGEGDFEAAGPVAYPSGVAKELPLGRSVIVEGKAELVAPIKPRGGNASGVAKGTLRYQVCTDSACDRPRSVPFSVAVSGP